MKIIVGLGNPGKKYQNTRHNIGFQFLDILADHPEINAVGKSLNFKKNSKLQAEIAETINKGEKIILVKPSTFMNLSGEAVQAVLKYYRAKIEDLIVICDDVDLPVGRARIRLAGSSGGHKGLESIMDNFKSQNFVRIRIGISDTDKPSQSENQIDVIDFVLGEFQDREIKIIQMIMQRVLDYLMPRIGSKEVLEAHTIHIPQE